MYSHKVLSSALYKVFSGNQLKHEKHYKGHLSRNDCVPLFEILLSFNGITDTGIQKLKIEDSIFHTLILLIGTL